MFNRIFETGTYPSEWTKSLIYPLHKKGDPSDVNNYRGISLLNILSKVFSSIINCRLTTWAHNSSNIPEEQAGFRKGYSTIDNIFTLQSIVQKYLSKKQGRFYVLFVDFSKAFDCIDRAKLFYILYQKGLRGNLLKIIQCMYKQVLAAIRIKTNKRG